MAVVAADDSAAACLGPLAARGCQVLGVCSGDATCPVLARRCVELGFDFARFKDAALAGLALDNFAPEAVVFASEAAASQREALSKAMSGAPPKQYVVRVGLSMSGAPWPEFAPLFLGHETSTVLLLEAGSEAVVARSELPLSQSETAFSLRAKHAEAAATLLAALIDGNFAKAPLPAASAAEGAPAAASSQDAAAPTRIGLDWEETRVGRYIRAHYLPPHDYATVIDPAGGEEYSIESMEQYREFRAKVLNDHSTVQRDGVGVGAGGASLYAADTHWYSNVGGSIIKMGDSNVHMPVRTALKRTAVIPGAAICGRKKLRMNEPLIGMNAERYCASALDSGWIGVEGPYVKRFERQLAEICGCQAACAVQSGTAALYGAMKALGVSDPSHHVLVPAFTCAAAADAVVHAGGLPVPVDCELDSYGVSLAAVRDALDADRSVVGVCLAPCYGVPARDTFEILALCKERGLWLCEDACETYGASKSVPNQESEGTRRVPVGSLATLCVVSVRSEKMIGVGEGGAILGNDTTLVAKAKWWCSRAPTRGAGLWRVYEHDAVGQNFRLPEMLAAVGCAAAEMLPLMIERKRAIHTWYAQKMDAHPALSTITLQKAASDDEPVWWINAALLPDGYNGEEVGMRLMKEFPDIEIRPGFYPMNLMDIFKSKWCRPCPNSELLYKRLVCLPSSNQLTEADIDRVCAALATALAAVKS